MPLSHGPLEKFSIGEEEMTGVKKESNLALSDTTKVSNWENLACNSLKSLSFVELAIQSYVVSHCSWNLLELMEPSRTYGTF